MPTFPLLTILLRHSTSYTPSKLHTDTNHSAIIPHPTSIKRSQQPNRVGRLDVVHLAASRDYDAWVLVILPL
ncbi:hypothetical protein EDD16DRAFT_1628453 [Pisolithus croceorrhizus]|nr:hypothetical protein EDD16DRAFT_1628453 [Pisolithus croceorrhizus]KAI6160381.1 hypothetical protein EDD17DRAFT_1602734 [Pisolithus thermaeus]